MCRLYLATACLGAQAVVISSLLLVFQFHAGADDRPNIILINFDDADAEMMNDARLAARFPTINSIRLAGLRFTNVHVAVPYCGPSRASLFRGQLPFHTGILVNGITPPGTAELPGGFGEYKAAGYYDDDLGVRMKQSGYRTMMVGKYLYQGFDFTPSAGWDDFFVSYGGEYHGTNRYISRNGSTIRKEQLGQNEYRTKVEGRNIESLLSSHFEHNDDDRQPVFLYFAPFGPHLGGGENRTEDMIDSDRYGHWWHKIKNPLPPAFNELDASDKHPLISNSPLFNEERLTSLDRLYRSRVLSVRSVDDVISDIMALLTEFGEFENTYIIISSDNGFSMGKNRIVGKCHPLEPATNVPCIVWGPGIPANETADHLISHIDIMPTILDIANTPIPDYVDGKSFYELLHQHESVPDTEWQQSILIQHWQKRPTRAFHIYPRTFSMLRMHSSSYIEWADGFREYYDLTKDPNQFENQYSELSEEEQVVHNAMLSTYLDGDEEPEVYFSDPPFGTTSPVDGLRLVGFAQSSRPIRYVRVQVMNKTTGLFWNEFNWQEERHTIVIDMRDTSSILVLWELELAGLGLEVGEHQFRVTARSVDEASRISSAASVHEFRVDNSPPQTTITSPEHNFAGPGPIPIAGISFDNKRVRRIELTVTHRVNGRYWNGSRFQTKPSRIVVPVDASGNWAYEFPLDIGKYRVFASAVDNVGNKDHTPAQAAFTLVK